MMHGEYELDPENGAFVKDVHDQLTSPRRGGPRFIDPAADPSSNRTPSAVLSAPGRARVAGGVEC
jgi:hypothetical protein